MQESDWDLYLNRLVEETKSAIRQFAVQHGDEEISYFAYDSDPQCGYVLTCFNTLSASLEFSRKQQERRVSYRRKLMAEPAWFDHAYYQVRAHALLPFCNNTGDFAYQGFTEIKFPEWEAFWQSSAYPQTEDHDEDYLINRVARLFCRAIDQLVEERAFERLRLAQPTLIGFVFHEDEQKILHMLNLPNSRD
ncbi:MAG: hypothetical protein FWC42_09765 [Proteobacteria bacterium]|nr:hypothetical protein [Pseudomonadota bacterium]